MDSSISVRLDQAATGRHPNRREALLTAAARCFVKQNYAATSMRDIAAEAGMKAGSIYYHFSSKEELFLAIYKSGVHSIRKAVEVAIATCGEPWQCLEAACAAHLTVLLTGGPISQVIRSELPPESMSLRPRLVELRDNYESIFTGLVENIGLPLGVDRHEIRLMLMGAMNYAHTWYHTGDDTPAEIAGKFVRFLRLPMDTNVDADTQGDEEITP